MKNFAIYKTQVGFIKIVYVDGKVISLGRFHEKAVVNFGEKTKLTEQVFSQITEYLEGNRKTFDFAYELRGTEFQKKVWKALCDIPYGETRSYKDVARAVGNEKASRAIGMANNKNPIGIAVPCHRVIGTDGKLVGYAGGIDMKMFLLDMEANNK